MRRIFLLLVMVSSFAFSAIDECKTDVYFGNGILTSPDASKANTILLRDAIIEKFGLDYFQKKIGKVDYAYNRTIGDAGDLFESFYQIIGQQDRVDWWANWLMETRATIHSLDLEAQVDKYEASIRLGHRVLVVTHSQGNLFAQEAYETLGERSEDHDQWLQKYFEAVSIASPDPITDIKPNMPDRIGWDNDMVAIMGGSNNNFSKTRQVYWEAERDNIGNFPPVAKPRDTYVNKAEVDTLYEHLWRAKEGFAQKYLESNVHAFTFYMGLPLKDGDNEEHVYINPFTDANLTDDSAKILIMDQIKDQLDKLEEIPSQYKIKKEIGCICNEKYVKIEHRWDNNLSKNIERHHIKDFAGGRAGKIYPVNGKYVRAECGGVKIEEVDEDDVCLALMKGDIRLGEISGPENAALGIEEHHGAIDMILSWDHECDIDMNLHMSGSEFAIQDIKDIPNHGKEHIYIPTQYQIFPGDEYIFSADGKKVAGSSLQESKLDDDPVQIRALLSTPTKKPYFQVWEAKNFRGLALGKFAKVEVKHKVCPALNGDTNWTRVRNPATQKYQCLPCKIDDVRWQVAIYAESWEYDSSCHLSEVDKLLKQAEWYCDCRKADNPSNIQELYNRDTEKYQCLTCENTQWQRQRIKHYEINCTTRDDVHHDYEHYNYEWDAVDRLGTWKEECGHFTTVHHDNVRAYDQCDREQEGKSCGCVPCDYIVSGMRERVENGPIAGADITIIKASEADMPDPEVLYNGKTTDDDDIFKSGFIEIPQNKLDKFDDDTYYLIRAKGGQDIDSDDDMHRDIEPTDNNGVIHAIIKGDDLKNLPYRVNILTEAIYQVTGGGMGSHYNADALYRTLNDISQKLLKKKLYPGDDGDINYHDILLWTPAVDKKALYKPFGIYVEPIIEKLYANKDRYTDSYRLIYDSYDSNAPELAPLNLEIPSGLPNGTTIAHITTYNEKFFESIELKGKYKNQFNIDNHGNLKIAQSDLIRLDNKYNLRMRAVDSNNIKGNYTSLNIEVTSALNLADPNASVPILSSAETFTIDENAPVGTLAATIKFHDANSTIASYRIGGKDADAFIIDNTGDIKVAFGANIDYEKSKEYHIKISAINTAGNESYPVSLTIPIKNRPDTPLFDLIIFEHVMENSPIGTNIATIRQDREGLGQIERFEILSPNIPFEIDNNGTLLVSGYIDYEQKRKYGFYAIAVTPYGNSNKIDINIDIDDQKIEEGLPILYPIDISVDENITSGKPIAHMHIEQGASPIKKIILYGDNNKFRAEPDGTLYLRDGETLDYEEKTLYSLGARALNDRGFGDGVHVTINVNNIADELPTLENFSKSVEENITAGTIIGKIVTSGTSEIEINSFELIGTGNENFTIDTNGTIRASQNVHLDYENKHSYLLQVIAFSTAGSSTKAKVTIYILNIPEYPPVLKPFTRNIEENATIGSIVGKIIEDTGGDSPIISYELNNTDVFFIDSTGLIRTNTTLDYETQNNYTLKARASNSAGYGHWRIISISIENIIDDEPVLNPLSTSIEENTSIGTQVGIIDINSTGTSDIVSIALDGNGAEMFSVSTDGNITVLRELDYEAKQSYTLNAIATNAKGSSEAVDITISIINIPDNPPRLNSQSISIDENTSIGTEIVTIDIAWIGDSNITSFDINNTETFSIDHNGTIRLTAQLDSTIQRIYDINVTATNEAGVSNPAILTIRVRSNAFITKWKTDNYGTSQDNQITIPTIGDGYNYSVYWGDGESEHNISGDITHTYPEPGIYTVHISGDFPQIYFGKDHSDKLKILSIEQWGAIKWRSMNEAFAGCENVKLNAIDAPNLSHTTDLSWMFLYAKNFNASIEDWNTSNITNLNGMFLVRRDSIKTLTIGMSPM